MSQGRTIATEVVLDSEKVPLQPRATRCEILMGFERKLLNSHAWKRFFFEKATEPIHVNVMAMLVWCFGSLRARVLFDLIIREYHAYSLLRAADLAKEAGVSEFTVIEFGVAAGTGLMNLSKLGEKVTKETGVKIHIVGFDTGQGMPPPVDYRDHPNLYKGGDFPMDFERLKRVLPANVSLELGNVEATLPSWLDRQTPQRPIGYIVMDFDYYSSTAVAMQVLSGAAELYLPFVITYFDDIHFDDHNDACGELLAIKEFNDSHENRIIQRPAFLPNRRVYKNAPWLKHIFFAHILDHPYRASPHEHGTHALANPFL